MRAVSTKASLLRHLRLIGITATLAAGGLILAGSAASQSVTPQSVDPMQHFIDCAGVLISAPDVHAANCLPSNVPPDGIASLTSGPPDDDDCIPFDVIDDSASACDDIPVDDVPDNVLENDAD